MILGCLLTNSGHFGVFVLSWFVLFTLTESKGNIFFQHFFLWIVQINEGVLQAGTEVDKENRPQVSHNHI